MALFDLLSKMPHLLGLIGLICVFSGLCVCVYRLTLHPLAKYPGPFLAKITSWYAVYHQYIGDVHLDMWACHQKYGEFVRYGPNRILINSTGALKEIYGTGKNVQKADAYSAWPAIPGSFSTHTAINKAQHARKRRILGHGFSESALRAAEQYIAERVSVFCKCLGQQAGGDEKSWTGPKNISEWAGYLTFDIMGELIFGKSFNMLEDEQTRFVINAIDASAHRNSVVLQLKEIGSWGLDKYLFPSIIAKRAEFGKIAKAMVGQRIQTKDTSDRQDIFSFYVNAKDPETGVGFPTSELIVETMLLMTAGSDTTATAIAASLFYLSRHPHAYARATAEVRAAFPHADSIAAGPVLNGCAYLRACIDEAMRMTPPVGGALWREVMPGGATVQGNFFPAGIDVGVGIYTVHHSPEAYPAPWAFKPERWMAEEEQSGGKEQVEAAKAAFTPFSIGSRGCIGKSLAYMEAMITLANVLFMFDFEPVQETKEVVHSGVYKRHLEAEFFTKDHFVSWKDGPMLRFRRRV